MQPLPVDAAIDDLRAALSRRRAAVLVASPGAGKTTRVAPSLVDTGRVLVLQPRRIAARAVARRIAEERGWTLGRDVGWHVRLERRYTPATPLVIVTEGILTARLLQDPLLSDVTTVVFDEFHERSIHADLGLALARQAWRARDDLRILVMSATLDPAPVSAFLDGCPVIDVPGTLHPLQVEHAPGEDVATAVRTLLPRTRGQVLCFLPGAREIERARAELRDVEASGIEVLPLHGSLDGAAQDAAIASSTRRRVILATNIAETSLTVPGVAVVVDTGRVKVARHDHARGVDRLDTEWITRDAADQRAGRAARLGPGTVRRLWDARDRLRPQREPDIARVDLAGPLLDVIAWGGAPSTFEWFQAPSAGRIDQALAQLERLDAIARADGRVQITAIGRLMQRLPLPPRLARILIDGRAAQDVAAACALLAEGAVLASRDGRLVDCDLAPALDDWVHQPPHLRQLATDLRRLAASVLDEPPRAEVSMDALRHALFAGFADRLAKRRPDAPDRCKLASGHGATLARESGVRDGDYLVALDLVAAERDRASEARIRLASRVDPAWITPTHTTIVHRVADEGRVRASRIAWFDAIVLHESSVPVSEDDSAAALRDAWLARPHDARTQRLLARAAFAGVALDVPALVEQAAIGARVLDDIDIAAALAHAVRRDLDALAPDALQVPSGRASRLEYGADGTVSASVKLQELFGLADSPRLGPARVPVVFHLLAPNGRPVQTTTDLRSFWERTYPEVRKELRGRYPKHPWPDDPWSAKATHRTTRRG